MQKTWESVQGIKVHGHTINNRKLADDIDLSEKNLIKLQERLHTLTKTALNTYALEVNTDQTKVIVFIVCCQLVDVRKELNEEQHSSMVRLLVLKRYGEAITRVSSPNIAFLCLSIQCTFILVWDMDAVKGKDTKAWGIWNAILPTSPRSKLERKNKKLRDFPKKPT